MWQGNYEDTLPETLLGTIRLKHLELSAAPFLDIATKQVTLEILKPAFTSFSFQISIPNNVIALFRDRPTKP